MRVRTFFASLAAVAAAAASISLAQADTCAQPTPIGLQLSADTASQQFAPANSSALIQPAAEAPLFSVPGKSAALRNAVISAPLTSDVSFDAGFNLDLQGRFNGFSTSADHGLNGLFLSNAGAPFAGFTSGGNFIGATIALASDLHLQVGRASLDTRNAGYDAPVFDYLTQPRTTRDLVNLRTATTSMTSLDWDFAPWGGLGLVATDTSERHSILGVAHNDPLASNSDTRAMGMSAHVGLGQGWVTTVSYSEGISQLDLRANSLAANNDTLHSRAYSVAIAKHGLFADNDSLGVSVSRPIQIYAGSNSFGAPLDDYSHILGGTERVSLLNGAPETDFEMGYVTTFLDGSVALQANASWQQNLAGQQGVNSLSVLSRAKINF